MKSPYILPALTAVIGFTIAWVAKPGDDPAPVADAPAAEIAAAKADRPSRTTASDRRPTGQRPKEVRAGDFPLADAVEEGPKTREEAKMLRLTEALGLSIEQQGEIISLIENVQATASDKIPVIDDLVIRGKAIEDGLAAVLTPEQMEKFQEIRVRERENRAESRAQKVLAEVIEDVDLSPDQREDVLGRLRQKSKADLQSIPAAATLLFEKSLLPNGGKELSADGVLLLAKIGEPMDAVDPMVARQKVLDSQKLELEELLRCFDGILTPAQMGQFQASIHEKREAIQGLRMGQAASQMPEFPLEQSAPAPPAGQ